MDLAGGDEGVNPRAARVPDGLPRGVDVLPVAPREAADDGHVSVLPEGRVPDLDGDGAHNVKVVGEEAVGDVLGPAPWLYCDPRTGRASARRRRALELARMAAAVAMGEVGVGAGGCAARRQRPSATAALEAAAGGMVATADGEQAEEKGSG